MGQGTNVRVDDPKDYTFQSTPEYQAALNAFAGQMGTSGNQMDSYIQQATQGVNFDPNAFMTAWNAAQPGLLNQVGSATGPLGQQLNALAQRSARMGGDAALQAMPGGKNSGAGMAAFGDAYANPFAQAAAQTQQAQLGLYGNLSGQQMSQFGQNYLTDAQLQAGQRAAQMQAAGMYGQQQNNMAGMYGQMASQQGNWIQPQYQYQASPWEQFLGVAPQIAATAGNIGLGFANLPPVLGAGG